MFKCLNPATIAPPFGRYTHGVEFSGSSNVIMTSGQLALHSDGTTPTSVRAQAELCFNNIEAILTEANATKNNVVKISAFVTDRSHMTEYMQARDAWLTDIETLPASTLVIVTGFTREEFLVEIEAIAVVPTIQSDS